VEFIDTAEVEGSGVQVKGVQFVTRDGAWRVVASDIRPNGAPDEWHVWQRMRGADPRNPHGFGYVRRLAWARFSARDQAGAAAALLDALPATVSARVLGDAVTDRLRGLAMRVMFESVYVAHALLAGARDLAQDAARNPDA